MPITTDTELFSLRTLNKEQLIERIQQLKQFHEWDKIGTLKWNEAKDENKELKEQISALKREIFVLKEEKRIGWGWEEKIQEQLRERDELKKENECLKEQLEDDTRQVHQLFKENEELKEATKMIDVLQKSYDIACCKKNEELQKEIEELKDEMEEMYDEDGVYMSSTYQDLEQEHEKLKEDKEQLDSCFQELCDDIIRSGATWGACSHPSDLVSSWVKEKLDDKPFRVYLGSNAYKVDLPCQEQWFETLDEAKKYIDELNKGDNSIKVSYDSIDYQPYE